MTPVHVCETHKEETKKGEFCNSCIRMYHNNCDISFNPTEHYIRENIHFWETLIEGLMTKMGLDPYLKDYTVELEESQRDIAKL